MIKIATHSGGFHADDVFSVATFQLLLGKENIEVIRTRDDEVLATADYVVDVGRIYDHEAKRYDHHQVGAPVRSNGIPYSGFGLIWKHYGEELCKSVEVADKIEEKLCVPIDLCDNGISVWEEGKYSIQPLEWDGIIKTWQAETTKGEDMDLQFSIAVDFAREYLTRVIQRAQVKLVQEVQAAKLYESGDSKSIIVSESYIPSSLFIQYPEVLVLVFPRIDTNDWAAMAIKKEKSGFETKVKFPESWGGLSDRELAKASGFEDAVFCHKNLHMFVSKSKESVMTAAKLAK